MALHALMVNYETEDFITVANGGQAPLDDFFKTPTYFVHPDRVDDEFLPEFMTRREFEEGYEYHSCQDPNCNIVIPKNRGSQD